MCVNTHLNTNISVISCYKWFNGPERHCKQMLHELIFTGYGVTIIMCFCWLELESSGLQSINMPAKNPRALRARGVGLCER